jgi:trypsin
MSSKSALVGGSGRSLMGGFAGQGTTAPTATSATAESHFPVTRQGWTASNSYPSNIGRLYFTVPSGQSKRCTATVVDTNIIITAAHCVYEAGVGPNSNFKFVPAQQGTTAPYGSWVNGRGISYDYWNANGFYPLDYAFVKFPPSNGRNLATTVGASSFLINPPLDSALDEVGYPATGVFSKYSGNYLWFCLSPLGGTQSYGNGWYTIGIGCSANGGTSGGPWYESVNGTWSIASVTSTCWNDVIFCNDPVNGISANLYGAYFTDWTRNLFYLAQGM